MYCKQVQMRIRSDASSSLLNTKAFDCYNNLQCGERQCKVWTNAVILTCKAKKIAGRQLQERSVFFYNNDKTAVMDEEDSDLTIWY